MTRGLEQLSLALLALGLAGLLYAAVVLLDPYGLRATPGAPPRPLMDLNQRFMYPQIVRSGRFDSAVFGTSTVRLLNPQRLNETFGGRFANLGLTQAPPGSRCNSPICSCATFPHRGT